ncbi:MAG: hypothetical protein FD123_862 [Bacteroidetes bacterium]|nr:MAG: hypothetical protein FD123_862 [Bacteroidota bacterium]
MAENNITPQQLEKLTIQIKGAAKDDASKRFTVMFNPLTFAQKMEIEQADVQGTGSTGSAKKYLRIKPVDFSFEFILDGTGTAADAPAEGIVSEINKLLTICYHLEGKEHKPNTVEILWGKLKSPGKGDRVMEAVFKSVDVNYTLFQPDGTPIRAKIVAVFSENIPLLTQEQLDDKQSPDLTRFMQVKTGSKFPLMVNSEYKTQKHCISIARINKLDSMRRLAEGKYLRMPPYDKSVTQ